MIPVLEPINFTKVATTPATSIAPLACRFPNSIEEKDLNDLDTVWRELRNINVPIETQSSSTYKFWVMEQKMTCGDGIPKFPLLSKFVLLMLSLPHSIANTEGVFSQINLNKTKTRNRMDTSTLQGLLYTKGLVDDNTCFNFPMSLEVLKRHKNSMYDQSKE